MCLKKFRERLVAVKACADEKLTPLVLLAMRLYVARAFFTSGWSKLGYVLHSQLDTLYSLFEETYKVPLLPTKLAAWLGMAGELGLSTLLALGFCARFGALGLIVMSEVIYYVESHTLGTAGTTHTDTWALICALIAVHGPGKWSVDAWMCGRKKASQISA